MKKFKCAVICWAAGFSLFAGSCAIESWKIAVGPLLNGDKLYAGVELETNTGVDVLIPLGSGWLN